MKTKHRYSKAVKIWLIIGLVMLVGQVILGGITRLTGSGLSITKWDIVSGVVPPLNQAQWQEAFALYKQTPQYHKINSDFVLSDFKFIYFWEYAHRLWVRILGFVFLIPFIYFLLRKKIDGYLIRRLALVIFFTALTASAGWIMVQSGLVNRPWVNAYKLSLHFTLAIVSIAAMVKTIADAYDYGVLQKPNTILLHFLIFIIFLQMIVAGLMAGMKAGLYFSTWPSMHGAFIPLVLKDSANWSWHNLTNYDSYLFAPALVQFTHRMLAYTIFVLMIFVFYKYKNHVFFTSKNWLIMALFLVFLQIILGILTLLDSGSGIPLFYGAAHQLVGVLFWISILFFSFSLRKRA